MHKIGEASSNQDLHCLSFDASLCDTDTKCGVHFFRVLFIVLFYCCHIFNTYANLHCYQAHACTNTSAFVTSAPIAYTCRHTRYCSQYRGRSRCLNGNNALTPPPPPLTHTHTPTPHYGVKVRFLTFISEDSIKKTNMKYN